MIMLLLQILSLSLEETKYLSRLELYLVLEYKVIYQMIRKI